MADQDGISSLIVKLPQADLRKAVATLVLLLSPRPPDSSSIKRSCEEVLRLLRRKTSYTSENCRIIDAVVLLALENAGEDLKAELPEGLYKVLWDMGGQLHDSIQAREVAQNFASTPEALLARLM